MGKPMYTLRAMIGNDLDQHDTALRNVLGYSHEQREALKDKVCTVLSRKGLDAVAPTAYGSIVRAMVAEHKRVAAGQEIDHAARDTAKATARAVVHERFPTDGEDLLRRAEAFVRDDAELSELLETGAGSDPDVVVGILETVHSSGYRPKA